MSSKKKKRFQYIDANVCNDIVLYFSKNKHFRLKKEFINMLFSAFVKNDYTIVLIVFRKTITKLGCQKKNLLILHILV